jgi:hypothetical protein
MADERYNSSPDRFSSIGIELKDNELDILELFAQTGALTTMQITEIMKSTELERAYKNVHETIQLQQKRKLIEKIEVKRRRNNEKYFKLTDDGIYQLFLKRPYGILSDQLSFKKGQPPISYVDRFLRYHGKNLVFKLFLSPYFEDQTISVDNFGLLLEIFSYVTDCCKRLETTATARQIALLFKPKFSWNKAPGEDNKKLIESLNEIDALQYIDEAKIKKSDDNNVISVITPENLITIRLNTQAYKAEVSIGKITIYEYKITIFGSDITVGTAQKLEDPIKSTLNRSKKIIEPYIFKLVSNLGEDEMRVLANDTKFMRLLDDINTKFEAGFKRLMELRKIS